MRWVPPAHSPLQWSDVIRALNADGASLRVAHDEVRRAFNADAAALCDSGTTALALALRTAARTHPGAIAVPAYACFDIATALADSNDVVIPYDVSPDTLGPDPESLARTLVAGAQRVVVAPLYGQPLEWNAVRSACDAAGAIIIEDAAQGSGARWRGTPHGALGELAVLSFGRGKGRTAGGGGAVVARGTIRSAVLRDDARALTGSVAGRAGVVGRVAAQIALSSPARFGWVASVPAFGIGETRLREFTTIRQMSRAHAALVPSALAQEPLEVAARRTNAARWAAELPSTLSAPRTVDGGESGALRCPVLRATARPLTVEERRLGIGAPYPQVLTDLAPIAARLPRGYNEPLTGARTLVERLITLPTHSLLEEQDKVAITRWLRDAR